MMCHPLMLPDLGILEMTEQIMSRNDIIIKPNLSNHSFSLFKRVGEKRAIVGIAPNIEDAYKRAKELLEFPDRESVQERGEFPA